MAEETGSQATDTQVVVGDKWSMRLVVGGLVAALVASVSAYVVLAALGSTVPTELSNIATGLIGALAGVLSPIGK